MNERWERMKERLLIALAWAVPRSVAYWVFVRVAGDCNGNPAERTCGEALRQWRR